MRNGRPYSVGWRGVPLRVACRHIRSDAVKGQIHGRATAPAFAHQQPRQQVPPVLKHPASFAHDTRVVRQPAGLASPSTDQKPDKDRARSAFPIAGLGFAAEWRSRRPPTARDSSTAPFTRASNEAISSSSKQSRKKWLTTRSKGASGNPAGSHASASACTSRTCASDGSR